MHKNLPQKRSMKDSLQHRKALTLVFVLTSLACIERNGFLRYRLSFVLSLSHAL
jgi:hypothetical protein